MAKVRSRFGLAVDGIVSLALAAAAGCSGATEPVAANAPPDGGETTSLSDAGPGPGPIVLSDGAVPVDAGPFTVLPEEATFACDPPLPEIVGGLEPGTPVDYLEIRSRVPYGEDAGAAVPGAVSTGTPCTETACRAALVGANADGWQPTSGCEMIQNEILVYSRGNSAAPVGKAELAAFLAPIDTLEEARLMLRAHNGANLACDQPEGKSGWRKNADGSFEILTSFSQCPVQRGRFKIEPNGTVTTITVQTGTDSCVCGRRFEGLPEGPAGGASVGLAEFLAEMAYLEAASVVAFRRFEEELVRLRAPALLVQRARASRADEIRHARMTALLAKVHGGVVAPVEVPAARARSVFEIALENAVEGCVREAYGALVAAYQARTAKDPELRRAMRIIAVDEAKHAELAHDAAAWLDHLLTPAERARIDDARREALLELEAAVEIPPAADVREAAGVPDVVAARALLGGLRSFAACAHAA